MAAPIAPLAGIALRYVGMAAAGYTLARILPRRAPDPRVEAAMDEMPDGLELSADHTDTRLRARLRRVVRLGNAGLSVDAALLARLRVRRA